MNVCRFRKGDAVTWEGARKGEGGTISDFGKMQDYENTSEDVAYILCYPDDNYRLGDFTTVPVTDLKTYES